MDIICAGFPKTATKSCSAALREIGFNVADMRETFLHLMPVFDKYFKGQATIEDVISEYENIKCTVNQDWPGNMLWEELYRASPHAKVILTVRKNDKEWFDSLIKFMIAERSACGNFPWYFLSMKFLDWGFLGKTFHLSDWIAREKMELYLPGVFYWERSWTWETSIENIKKNENVLRQAYRKHIAYVKSVVPADRLLIWDLSTGWQPLCDFLKVEVPLSPIPKVNKTGDNYLMAEMGDVFKEVLPDGRNRNNKSFIRELFNYGCHCYPGGSKNILKSGRGKPLDTIDEYCRQHKICYKCINSIFNDGQWNGEESRCNPAESSYKMIANMSAYTVKCSEDQNPCRKAICECDLHYAEQVTSLDFEANHNPAYLQRNGFDYDSSCIKRGNYQGEHQCCGDRNSFPYPQIMTKQKSECCSTVAFNPNREECCYENVVAKIGKCDTQGPY
ncbi:Oidioi.mRNA.OKI2018_I69.XSR.g15801.t1.cds [Oikopleura dioica]|uniref:Oidioi.mRNA.OKI2018_I69.XSR.g15801.t1.cds n=1 Tax=Oikopleura dioica TaxID=34765 RepID=A0ABN7SHZ4_OIKDI|nr:Oidioi.mRNA.OKI2018_I69.XSR.g15801.t1.cds [Oikopleura dioica]